MAARRVVAWTPEMDALLGTMPDAAVARMMDEDEERARYRRRRLGIPPFRAQTGPVTVPCANCGRSTMKPRKALKRSRALFCSRTCADAGQKRRDSDALR